MSARVSFKQADEVSRLPKMSYRIDEAVAVTGLSRPTLYRLIAKGDLSIVKVGTRTLIMASVLEDFLTQRTQPHQAA